MYEISPLYVRLPEICHGQFHAGFWAYQRTVSAHNPPKCNFCPLTTMFAVSVVGRNLTKEERSLLWSAYHGAWVDGVPAHKLVPETRNRCVMREHWWAPEPKIVGLWVKNWEANEGKLEVGDGIRADGRLFDAVLEGIPSHGAR